MSNTVLLARPHPFIVADMGPFLTQSGFTIAKAGQAADLDALAAGCAGAVVSLALASSIPESAAEIVTRLRRRQPRLPVLFAAMLPLDKARFQLEQIARQSGIQASIIGVDSGTGQDRALGQSGGFLYISRDDLTDGDRRARASTLIRRHFGQAV